MKPLDPQGDIFQSEFAMVMVRRDEAANGARLFIKDVTTGNHIYLDPLELEALTRLDHDHFVPLVSPRMRETSVSFHDVGSSGDASRGAKGIETGKQPR